MNTIIHAIAHTDLLSPSNKPEVAVLSTRIRLARNLKEYAFPGWANETQRQEVWHVCQAALKGITQLKKAESLSLSDLSELERQVLMERHLISPELVKAKDGAGVIVTKNQAFSVMVNEEDHLRIQIMRNGFNFKKTWALIDQLDDAIEERLPYAFSAEFGYLTACPTNLGTAMRASVMLHLPGLVLSDQIERVVRAISHLGLVVRGLFGEGSDASGSIFQISNQQSLGESEAALLKHLSKVLETIIEQEQNARQKLLTEQREKLLDKLGRAYGILQHTHCLSSGEALDLLSLMRLAADLEILPPDKRSELDRLMVITQPAHIQAFIDGTALSVERDILRAKLVREVFEAMPPLALS